MYNILKHGAFKNLLLVRGNTPAFHSLQLRFKDFKNSSTKVTKFFRMLQQEEEESVQSQGAKQFSTNTDTKNIY